VLEHIEKDGEELAKSVRFLKDQGVLAVLAPAHQSMFTAFDTAIGHYRRYDKSMLPQTVPEGLRQERLIYLDCVGL
jgi:hypothetical protein